MTIWSSNLTLPFTLSLTRYVVSNRALQHAWIHYPGVHDWRAVCYVCGSLLATGTIRYVASRSTLRMSRSESCIVPIVGMLCGSTISGVVISVNYVLKELQYVFIALTNNMKY